MSNPAEAKRALEARLAEFVGKDTGPPSVGPDLVNEAMIRHWCEAMGDRDPIYTDGAARGNPGPAGAGAILRDAGSGATLAEIADPDHLGIADGGDLLSFARVGLTSRHYMDSGTFGCLGVGPGYAIGVGAAGFGERIVCVLGDGAFGLNGMDFDTLVRFGIPAVLVVGNDAAWGQMMRPQGAIYGWDRLQATLLRPTRYDKVVEALGGHGEFVTKPDDILPAIERAFASGKPACVNVIIDQKPDGVSGGYEFLG